MLIGPKSTVRINSQQCLFRMVQSSAAGYSVLDYNMPYYFPIKQIALFVLEVRKISFVEK